MIKNVIRFFMLAGVASMVLACNIDDKVPADVSSIGKITSNRDLVGTGQDVVLSCPVMVSGNATRVEIKWETENGITVEPDKYDKGISYKTMSWKTAGQRTIKCKAQYIYANSEFKDLETTYTVTVRQSEFLKSFLGDSLERVMADNPGIVLEDSKYIIRESQNLLHTFVFTDGVLTTGNTAKAKDNTAFPSDKAAYSYFMTEVLSHRIENSTMQYSVYLKDKDFVPTDEQRRVIDEFKKGSKLDDAQCKLISGLVDSKTIALQSAILWKNWKAEPRSLVINCYVSSIAHVYILGLSYGSFVAGKNTKLVSNL